MKSTASGLQRIADEDLDRILGGSDVEGSAEPAVSASCLADLGRVAAGSAMVLASKMPVSTKMIASGLVGFYGGTELGQSCHPAVQRFFGVGPKKLFPNGAYR
jgi:hypothetical protein